MAPVTAEELLKHPEYKHTIWDLKPEKAGKVAVAKDRGGPINIAYEIHGHGDRHLVVSGSTFCINTTSNTLHSNSGSESNLGVRLGHGYICHASTSPITVGLPLSLFRFSRIDRLNLSSSRLMFLYPYPYSNF
jgi:hypothetical protein